MRPRRVPVLLFAALAASTAWSPAGHAADHTSRTARPAAVIQVSDAGQLRQALATAAPGDTVRLADGTYQGHFKATRSGTSSARITLTGSSRAVLRANGGGYGLHLDGASHWTVRGLTVTHAQKGVMVDRADHVVLDSVTVHDLAMEAVHFRNSSAHGVIRNSRIHNTGTNLRGMGEGVYVGSAGGTADRSDHVLVQDNVIGPNVRGEAVDVKEGTSNGRIVGNTFDGAGMTNVHYDDSWVDVKGNNYLVEGNTGRNSPNDGFQTHQVQPGWGCGTVFRGNHSDLSGATGPTRYAINVTRHDPGSCPVTVAASNTVTGGRGLVNPGVPVG